MTGFELLQKEVIGLGLCTFCGSCAGLCPTRSVTMNYQSELPELARECPANCQACYPSCPGKEIPVLAMERRTFGRERTADEQLLGISRGVLKGAATDAAVRNNGSSGGVVSALLIYALENKIIDGAIVVGMDRRQPWRGSPMIVTDREGVISTAQSRYNLVAVNAALGDAVDRGLKKMAVVGLACQVHALRKMQLAGGPEKVINSLKLIIGLVCGGNYSFKGTEHLIVEVAAVPLDQVARVQFREGAYPGRFTVTARDGKTVAKDTANMLMHCSTFKHDRCFVCYDYANDLADVSVGEYLMGDIRRGDPGLSGVIVRTAAGKKLVDGALAANQIRVEPLVKDNFYQGLFENKKHAVAYRLIERRRHRLPVPDFGLPLPEDYQRPMLRVVNGAHPYFA